MAAQLGASDDYVTTVSKERRAEIEAEVNEKGPGGWWHKREFYKVNDRDVPDENVHESWERISTYLGVLRRSKIGTRTPPS